MRLFSIFFLFGTLLIQGLTELPSFLWVGSLLCGSIIVMVFVKTMSKVVMILLVVTIALMSGFFLAGLSAKKQLDNQIPNHLQGKELIVQGKVVDIPDRRKDGIRFRLKVEKAYSVNDPDAAVAIKGIVRLGWYQERQNVQAGEHWQLKVKLKQPSGFMNPGGFDYEKWLFTERISATGYVRKDVKQDNKRLAKARWWSLNTIRERIHQTIQENVTNKASAAVLSALVVAIRTNLNDQQWGDLSKTGTTHLIAISGLHIAVVAAFAFLPIMLIWRIFPSFNEIIPLRVAGAVAGVVLAIIYAMLAGFTLPTQRALLMVLIALFGLLSRKHYSSTSILAVVLVAVLLLDPLAGMTISFWLSFVAVALILVFLKRQIVQPQYALIKLQFVLSLGMLPLTLLFFGSASLSSPIANFVAIPWVSLVVVPLSLIALMLMPLSSVLSNALFNLASITIDWMFKGLSFLSGSDITSLDSAAIPSVYLIMAFVGLIFLLLPKGFPARWLGLIAFLPVFFHSVAQLKDGEFEYTLLDVGQGMASVLRTQNHNLVYDTGTRLSDSFDIGKLVIVPFLHSKHIEQLDYLIVSHDDIDHSGGAKTVISEIDVSEVMASFFNSFAENNLTKCETGQQWQWDGVQFEILSPDHDFMGNDNNLSCVLKVSNKYHSLLLTGDIERKTEQIMIEEINQKTLNSEVMIVPHHGSKTSSMPAFIETVSPTLALIPVGYRNRFGHPKPDIVKRYKIRQIPILDTVSSGAITIGFPNNEDSFRIESYRILKRKFWNRR